MLARFVASLVVILSPVLAFGQALADRVPEKVILYAGWQGSESLGADYPKSNLKAFLDDSNVGQLFNEFLPNVLDKIGKQQPEAATAARLLSAIGGPMWRHPSAFFVAEVAMVAGQPPMPHLALITQAGREADAFKQELDAQLQNVPPGGPPILVSRDGDLVIVSLGYAEGELKLPAAGAQSRSLAHDPAFAKMVAVVGKGKAMTFYLDAAKLVATVDTAITQFAPDEAKQNWPKIRDALALGSLKQAIAASGFDGKEWGSDLFIAAPAPRAGLLAMLDAKPLSDDIFLAIPKNATMAGADHLNLIALLQGIRKIAAKIDPGVVEQMDSGLRSVSEAVGVDIETDFLGSFGDEWAFYVDPAVAGRGLMGMTILNRLQDPVKADATYKKLQTTAVDFVNQQIPGKQVQIRFASTKVGKVDVNYLAVPLITPSWAINNGNLYLGLYPEVVAASAGRLPGKGQSIHDNKDFAALFTRLGGEHATSFQFIDLQRTAPDTYGSWLTISHLSQIGDLFGVAAPPMVLPPLQKLLSDLGPAGQVSFTDADGFHVRSISPFPGAEVFGSDPMTVGVGQEAMLVSIMLPALNRAREQANRVKDASNLRQIGLGAMMYSNAQKNGAFPGSIGEIAKTQDVSPEVFFSPRSTTTPPPAGLTPDQAAAYVQEHSDYVWLGKGMKNTADADQILAYEKMQGVTEGINILYADGHVEFKLMQAARQEIEKQQKGKGDVN